VTGTQLSQGKDSQQNSCELTGILVATISFAIEWEFHRAASNECTSLTIYETEKKETHTREGGIIFKFIQHQAKPKGVERKSV
jgi:hypothetical protein